MGYRIKRCKICNQEIHVRNKRDRHGLTLRNTCEHIPNSKDKTFTEKELKEYLKDQQYL
jgi:hypothetical protein